VPICIEDNELVDRVPPSLQAVNGIPEAQPIVDHERAVTLGAEPLADLLYPDGVHTSPLVPGWSREIDLHLGAWPDPARLKDMEWMHLAPLLNRFGSSSKARWSLIFELAR